MASLNTERQTPQTAAQIGSLKSGSCTQRGLLSLLQPIRSLLYPYKVTGSGGLKTKQQRQERLNTKPNTALRPLFLFHLLPESAELPAVAGKHLSRVKFIPEKTTEELIVVLKSQYKKTQSCACTAEIYSDVNLWVYNFWINSNTSFENYKDKR